MKKIWNFLARVRDSIDHGLKRKAVLTTSIVALVAALPAHALTTSLMPLGDLSNKSLVLPVIESAPGDFLDVFEFSVVGSGVAFTAALNLPYDDPDFPGLESNFDIFTIAILDSVNALLAVDADGSDGFAVLGALPAAGLYRFAVLGVANGSVNGAYLGFIQTAVVPEPESYLLMLTAFGSLTLALWRRRQRPSGKPA